MIRRLLLVLACSTVPRRLCRHGVAQVAAVADGTVDRALIKLVVCWWTSRRPGTSSNGAPVSRRPPLWTQRGHLRRCAAVLGGPERWRSDRTHAQPARGPEARSGLQGRHADRRDRGRPAAGPVDTRRLGVHARGKIEPAHLRRRRRVSGCEYSLVRKVDEVRMQRRGLGRGAQRGELYVVNYTAPRLTFYDALPAAGGGDRGSRRV